MKILVVALAATLGTACAQAADKPVDMIFNAGVNFGMAEALVKACESAVVDPEIRQRVLAPIPKIYEDAFVKGFDLGVRKALEAAAKITVPATDEQKRCVLAIKLYGPEGTLVKNLIIPLGGDSNR
jgi:hypothetical protein